MNGTPVGILAAFDTATRAGENRIELEWHGAKVVVSLEV